MLSSRDFVVMATCKETEIEGKPTTFFIQNSVNMKGYEPTPNTVRASLAMCAMVQQHNETDIRMQIVQWFEMGGWFPD